MRLAASAVRVRETQPEQAKIVERAEPELGVEGGGGMGERRLRGLGVRIRQRGGACVVPGRVVVAPPGELGHVRGARAPELPAVPRPLSGRAWVPRGSGSGG